MAKPRKKHDLARRVNRLASAVLAQNRIAVMQIDPVDWQMLIDHKRMVAIAPSASSNTYICRAPHVWAVNIVALCVDQDGNRYTKGTTIKTRQRYRSGALTDPIKQHYIELMRGCNRAHVVGSGWIAIPGGEPLDEKTVFAIFEKFGGWEQPETAQVPA